MPANIGIGEGIGIPPPAPKALEIAKPDSLTNSPLPSMNEGSLLKVPGQESNSTVLRGNPAIFGEAAQIEEAMKILEQSKHEVSPPPIAEKKGIKFPTLVKIGFIGAALAALTTLWKSISQTFSFFGKKDSGGGMFPSTA